MQTNNSRRLSREGTPARDRLRRLIYMAIKKFRNRHFTAPKFLPSCRTKYGFFGFFFSMKKNHFSAEHISHFIFYASKLTGKIVRQVNFRGPVHEEVVGLYRKDFSFSNTYKHFGEGRTN